MCVGVGGGGGERERENVVPIPKDMYLEGYGTSDGHYHPLLSRPVLGRA
jgi:hypothetical protein